MERRYQTSTTSVVNTLRLVGNKWVMMILLTLREGAKRFGVLQKDIGEISPKVLTEQLKKLEREGLIVRRVFAEIPPRVEYSLSEKSQDLPPIIEQVVLWGERNR